MMDLTIRTGSIKELHNVFRQIPEFKDPYPYAEFKKRLVGKRHIILFAFWQKEIAGFKAGYHWDDDAESSTLYSWVGGVLPLFRRQGVASELAQAMEDWAKLNNYQKILCKTRNQHQAMLLFAITNHFKICGFEPSDEADYNKIWLEKIINQ